MKVERLENPLDRIYNNGTTLAETFETMADGFAILPPLIKSTSDTIIQIMFCSFMEGESAASAIADDTATAIIAMKDAFVGATKALDPIQDIVDDVALVGRKGQKDVSKRAHK